MDRDNVDRDGGRFQILSLDGGGLKGRFAAAIFAALEEDLGQRIVDHFDLVVGTSTGGLIALGRGAGRTPAELVDCYVDQGASYLWRSPRHALARSPAGAPTNGRARGVWRW